MKVTSRQPICITRLRKKSQSGNFLTTNQGKQSKVQIKDPNPYKIIQNQNRTFMDSFYKQYGKQNNTVIENQTHILKQNIGNQQNYRSIHQREKEQFMMRIKQLQKENQQLKYRNQDTIRALDQQKKQKNILNVRIENLYKDMEKLQSDFEQQYKKYQGKPSTTNLLSQINTINSYELIKSTNTSVRTIDLPRSSQGGGYRRLSFHQGIDSQPQDLSGKAKQYKNQLEIQKIKRVNLQRELNICKQNIRLQVKIQLQTLYKKIESMKEVIQRKDKEINQKQDLIQRYIVKK